MNKQLFLFLLVCAVMIGSVTALSGDDPFLQYKFSAGSGTNSVDSTGNGNTATNPGTYISSFPTYNVTGSSTPFSMNLSGGSDAEIQNQSASYASTTSWSVSTWVNVSAWKSGASNNRDYLFDFHDSGAGSTRHLLALNNGGDTDAFDGAGFVEITTDQIDLGSWQHIVYAVDGTSAKMYVNGTQFGSTIVVTARNLGDFDNFSYGGSSTSTQDNIQASYDETMLFNYTLTQADAAELYNSGFNIAGNNFTIAAVNIYDSTPIQNFSANITWNGSTNTYNTTSGTLITNITGELLANVTVYADNYFTNQSINHNTTANLALTLARWTGIYATDFNGATINNYTVTLDTVDYSTTNGLALIPLFNTSSIVSITNIHNLSVNYSSTNALLTANPFLENYTFQLYKFNTLNISFFNIDSLSKVNNVSVVLKGATVTYNFNTTTGSIEEELLNPDTYKVTASSTGYSNNILYVTLNNDNQTLNMYLETSTSDITFTVIDSLGDEVANASILITYNINGSVVTVAQAITDFSGIVVIPLDITKDYFLTVIHPDYAVFEGELIPSQSNYIITLQPSSEDTYISVFSVINWERLTEYNNITKNITVTLDIASPTGLLTYYGYNFTYNGTGYLKNNSLSPSGGTESDTFLFNLSDCITVIWFFKANGYDTVTKNTTSCDFINPSVETITTGLFNDVNLGVAGKAILATIITLIIAIAALLIARNISVGGIVAGLSLGFFNSIGFFPTITGYVAAVLLIAIVILSEVNF